MAKTALPSIRSTFKRATCTHVHADLGDVRPGSAGKKVDENGLDRVINRVEDKRVLRKRRRVEERRMNAAVRDLQTLFEVGSLGGLSDGQLLDRFVERREEAVFEAIVRRHGPMVWGVCRRVLRDHHDAEDAFQATFLVLARKAASVMTREKLGNWLYGVAYQTAMKARAMRAKRRSAGKPGAGHTGADGGAR